MIFKKLRLNAFVMAIISSHNKYDSLQWFNAHKRKPYNKLLLITRAAKTFALELLTDFVNKFVNVANIFQKKMKLENSSVS